MRNTFTILTLVILVWGCAKKITPAKSETPPPSNTGSAIQTPSQNNNERQASAPTPATNTNTTITPGVGGPTGTLPAATPKPEEAILIAGQQIFNAKCNRCHAYRVTTDYTADRWMSIMAVMSIKANLTQSERDNVTAYVRANSKK